MKQNSELSLSTGAQFNLSELTMLIPSWALTPLAACLANLLCKTLARGISCVLSSERTVGGLSLITLRAERTTDISCSRWLVLILNGLQRFSLWTIHMQSWQVTSTKNAGRG